MLKIKNKRRVIPNIVIGLVLLVGIIWVCAKFVHLGGVEYTNNAQVNQHQYTCAGIYQTDLF